MSLVGDWRAIERTLPDDWSDARLQLTVADAGDCARAAGLLGPAGPARSDKVIRFFAARRGAGSCARIGCPNWSFAAAPRHFPP